MPLLPLHCAVSRTVTTHREADALLPTLVTPDVWLFPTSTQVSWSLRHQLGALQLTSVLMGATWRECQAHRLRAPSAPRDCPHLRADRKQQVPGHPQLLSDLATNWGFPQPSRVLSVRYVAHRTQGNTRLRVYYVVEDVVKGRGERPGEQVCGVRPGGSRAWELLSPWSWGVPRSPHGWARHPDAPRSLCSVPEGPIA